MKEKIIILVSVLLVFAFGFFLGKEFVEPEVRYIEVPIVEEKIEEKEVVVEIETESIDYKRLSVVATAYCGENYPHICNDGDPTKTATGVKPRENHTIAADPNFLPYGTKVLIGEIVYVVEDCGGAMKGNNKVDIYFESHQEALDFGVQHLTAYIKGE